MDARGNAGTAESDRDIVRSLGTVGTAFFGGFRELREIQRRAVPPIRSGRNILVASATASGKTEAILAPLIARTLEAASGGVPRVRVLLIAPTRALVNDLTARIEGPLDRLGVTCGRQTGDHRDKGKAPFVLVTTPESFDSMLVRDARLQAGRVVDHLLAGVTSVFVDEAHLFDGTARGDQLSWLLGRLRRLRRLNVERATGGRLTALQLCAGSATVSDPEGLASRLLGTEAEVVRVEGMREIEVFGPLDASGWFPLEPSIEVAMLRCRLALVPSVEFAVEAGRRIWQALSNDGGSMRKVLVFVPTRRLCDTLSAYLSGALPRRRELKVFAHHGSLSRNRRERAEHGFASARDGMLEPRGYGRRWSVFVQQTASFVAQGRPRGRQRSDLLELARDVWPEESAGTADAIAENLLNTECLVEHHGRLALGEPWADAFDEGGRGMHANLDSSGGGIPVVDAGTGEIVAHVAQRPAEGRDLALGGQRWDVQEGGGGEILLKPKGTGGAREGFRYIARSAPTGLEYAVHVRRGLGLGESDAPVLDSPDGPIWLHFGGSGFQILLCALVPALHPIGGLAGLAVAGSRIDGTLLGELASRTARLGHAVDNHFAALEPVLSAGPFQRHLPGECRRRVVAELIDVPAFRRWLSTRHVWEMVRNDPRWTHVQTALLA